MPCGRFRAVLTAALLLVVYSGCGGEEKKDATLTGAGAATQAKAGEKGAASTTGAPAASADREVNALSLITPEHYAAIVIHPRRIAQSPLVAELLKDETIAAGVKKLGIDPGEVEQIVMLFSMAETQPGQPEPVPIMITRFTHNVDAKEVLTKLQAANGARKATPIQEINFGGKICLDLGTGEAGLAYSPGKNTIVLARKEDMGKVVSGAEPKGPLFERLKKAEMENDVIVALEPSAVPDFDKFVDMAKRGAPLDLDAAKKLQGGTATFNLTAQTLLRAVLDIKDAEAAANIEELLQQALRMAGGGLMLVKQTVPKEMRDTLGPLLKVADQLINGAKTSKSGRQVTLDVKRPEILDTAGGSIIAAVKQFVMESRTAALRAQRMNNLRQISIAMLVYEQAHQSFLPAIVEKDGKPLLSWRVAILPCLEGDALYTQFHLDEPWDSPHNLEVAKTVPAVFRSPDNPGDGKTRVMLFTGKGAAFDGGKKIGPADIRDGLSDTILCVEAGADKAVPWTKPEDLPFDPENPLAALGSVSPQGFIAAFFDGRVMQLKVDNKTLKALITPDGGERIDPAKLQGGR